MKTIEEIEKAATDYQEGTPIGHAYESFKAGAEWASVTQNESFEGAAMHLIKYLCENHHPHATVIVTQTGAELLEGVKTTGEILDYLKD